MDVLLHLNTHQPREMWVILFHKCMRVQTHVNSQIQRMGNGLQNRTGVIHHEEIGLRKKLSKGILGQREIALNMYIKESSQRFGLYNNSLIGKECINKAKHFFFLRNFISIHQNHQLCSPACQEKIFFFMSNLCFDHWEVIFPKMVVQNSFTWGKRIVNISFFTSCGHIQNKVESTNDFKKQVFMFMRQRIFTYLCR